MLFLVLFVKSKIICILGIIFFACYPASRCFFLAWLLEFVKAFVYPLTVAMLKAIATERKGSFFGMVMNDNEFEQTKRILNQGKHEP